LPIPASSFEYLLAKALGMTVTRMRLEMPHREFVYWQAYYARKAQREQLAQLSAKQPRPRR
jgi:hypothetical protein